MKFKLVASQAGPRKIRIVGIEAGKSISGDWKQGMVLALRTVEGNAYGTINRAGYLVEVRDKKGNVIPFKLSPVKTAAEFVTMRSILDGRLWDSYQNKLLGTLFCSASVMALFIGLDSVFDPQEGFSFLQTKGTYLSPFGLIGGGLAATAGLVEGLLKYGQYLAEAKILHRNLDRAVGAFLEQSVIQSDRAAQYR